MSGIFKGDSIYKSGGGGGGFKDGGQLVDGDFIKVENNTVSSYDNVSRDQINFYFEADGEVLNSVIELNTQVNSTVNVYILDNNVFYFIGNIGGNTVNSGGEYNINIVGDSYTVEEITAPSQEIGGVVFDGKMYGVTKIGSLYWTTSNIQYNFGTYKINNNEYYYKPESVVHLNIDGWRMPTKDEMTSLVLNYSVSDLCSKSGWSGTQGNNSTTLNIKPKGCYWKPTNTFEDIGTWASINFATASNNFGVRGFQPPSNSNDSGNPENLWGTVRLVKNV